MSLKELYGICIEYFKKNIPDAKTELHYQDPYQLVVAVSLSAQCTDKRVNMVTPALFQKFPTFKKLSQASFEEIFEHIKSISYPNNKAKNLIAMAIMVEAQFNSVLPNSVEELIQLPGVGRKTANVLTSVLFGQANMAVDTHVFRVSHRLGLVTKTDNNVLKVEKRLVKNIPKHEIALAHHWLILHGRYVCKAKKPICITCGLTNVCKFFKEQQTG